jgi:hypothetical protein
MFDNHYEEWRESRKKGLLKYVNKDYFNNKTLLELGCGFGDLGLFFDSLGSKVTCSDARNEHLIEINKRYKNHNIKTLLLDCDKDTINDKYDIILHWGLLYHLSKDNIKNHMTNILDKCNVLLLETEVCDSDEQDFVLETIEKGYDQAFNNKGVRPSASYIEKILSDNNFEYKCIKDPILNAHFHKYDWNVTETKTWSHGLRRYWICWNKNHDIKTLFN